MTFAALPDEEGFSATTANFAALFPSTIQGGSSMESGSGPRRGSEARTKSVGRQQQGVLKQKSRSGAVARSIRSRSCRAAADVYLDGKLHRTVDVYMGTRRNRVTEAVWHAFGLPGREHSLRVVSWGETPPGGHWTDITLEKLAVFR